MLKEEKKLEIVSNIKFTAREIDIISVILNNRGEKKIASLLDISPRTVSSHVHNIMLKIGQNSKDGIIDFIQKSGTMPHFNNHYQHILIQDILKKYLAQIKQEILKGEIDFPISKDDYKKLKPYEVNLKIAGINIIVESDSNFPSMKKFFDEKDYYSNLFSIVEAITGKSITQFSDAFTKETSSLTLSTTPKIENKRSHKLLYISLILVFTLITSLFYYHKSDYTPIARANLMLPHKDIYVERKGLLNKLDNILSNQNQISVAIISGMEGTGKTVLARSYAKSQKKPIIWEIDASSYGSMLSSFEQLSYYLTESKEDREELAALENIKSMPAKAKKLECFLSRKARKYNDWLMIYNDVKSFKTIEEYFPHDNNVWGNGVAIITTRNSNIKANNFIPGSNIIEIGELTKLEKKQLFNNILRPRLISKEKAYDNLIDKIPSYPLDIFHAATFIKEKRISCEDYLKYLSPDDKYHHKEGNASEVRKQIVDRSIDQILDKSPHLRSSLILVNSISSSYIPKDLLEFSDKDGSLLSEMKKLGLVDEKGFDKTHYTIHPVVQKVGLSKLKKLNFYKKSSIEASSILNNYINLHVNENNMEAIQTNISHLESFLQNNPNSISKASAELQMKLAESFFDIGSYKNAKKNYIKAEKIYRKFYSDLHPKIAKLNERMGLLHRNMGDYKKAKTHLEAALKSYSRIYPESNIKVAKVYLYLGSIYRNLSELDKAFAFTMRGYNIIHSIDASPATEIAKSEAYLGTVYTNMAKYDLSQKLLEDNLAKYKNFYKDNHTKTAWIKVRLAILYNEIGKIEEAKKLILEARKTYKDFCGENSIDYAWSSTHLGITNHKLGNHQEGNRLIMSSLEIYKNHYNKNHQTISWAKSQISNI